MSAGHRTVVVGEQLRPGAFLDQAIDRTLAAAGTATVSVAVLDRADGRTSLAVWIPAGCSIEPVLLERIRSALALAFVGVSVVGRPLEALAEPVGLT